MSNQTDAINLDDSITRPEFTVDDDKKPSLEGATNVVAPFDIVLNFTSSLTSSQQAAFENAEATWESLIIGYQAGITISRLTISASVKPIDGAGGILGSAGPTRGSIQNGFLLSTSGVMEFDSADVANLENGGTFEDVILHEMAHVIGLGTLWSGLDVGVSGVQELYIDRSGKFTGVNAGTKYDQEFKDDKNAPGTVPVEEGGGSGTQGGHWNENDGGAGLTGITNAQGQDFTFELMTGWLNPEGTFISDTTIQSFVDLGYVVVSNNEAPTIPSGNFSIDENQTQIGIIQGTDPDGDSLTYSITGGLDSNLFQINSNTGLLSFTTAPDYENPTDSNKDNLYQVEITANDGLINSQPALISVNVNDIDDSQPPANSLKVNVKGVDIEGQVIRYSRQDTSKSFVSYTDGGDGVRIEGNAWKQVEIGSYTVTPDTLLRFEFQSTNQGEIQGIGVDIDENYRNLNGLLFQLYGTETYGNQNYRNYQNGDGWKQYTISFGSFTGKIDSITFMNDQDVANPLSDSQFRNISLFESN